MNIYIPPKTGFQRAIETGDERIIQAARELAALKEAANSAPYKDAVKKLKAAIKERDQIYAKMRKAAEACTSDHAHASYDGEQWCQTCGGKTCYSRYNRRGSKPPRSYTLEEISRM